MKKRARQIITGAAAITLTAALCIACASVGSPDGGRFDDEPPVFLGSTPKRGATGVKTKNVTLEFNEIIKIENASEKVVISPPQKDQPEIQVNGKKIQVKLQDSLRTNTTYTIDFADAIVDNNEGNPLGDFCFSFSTGDQVDTLEVSGYVLDAENLEAVKGIQIGLYSDLADSCFTTKPFERVSRTDASGHFVIRGIAPGTYRLFALQDMDQNFYFSQRSEMVAWYDSLIVPSSEMRMRDDTIRNANGEVDTVMTVPYTHYLPDDIVLLAFKHAPVLQYLEGRDRATHEKFTLRFALPQDTLPILRGLNFDETDAYVIEHNATFDTITYWMRDTLVYYQDTLSFELTYLASDTLGDLVPFVDTLNLVPKQTRARILQNAARKAKEDEEKREKEIRRMERQGDSLGIVKLLEPKISYLSMNLNAKGSMDLNQTVSFDFKEPVLDFDPYSVIHVKEKQDTLMVDIPFEVEQDSINIRKFNIYAEWKPEVDYTLSFDSASITGLYGKFINRTEQKIKFKAIDQYSIFTVKIKNPKPGYTVQLLASGKEKVVRESTLENGSTTFYFLKPGSYYLRLYDDANGNGKWDTGDYYTGLKPESVYYLNKKFDLKQNWDHDVEWDVLSEPIQTQKPDEIKSQKADKKKERKNKNAERDAKIAEQQAKSRKAKRAAE